MRFKKGSKVEVLIKREVPSGSWWCAKIVSGNGHTYHVRYDRYPVGMGAITERVPRKAVRPCPPFKRGPSCWVTGDIVEFFDNHSWKLGEVSRDLGGDYFFVRLLGSSMEFKVHMSEIRVRQTWQDNIWVIVGKDSANGAMKMLSKEGRFFSAKTKPCLEETNYAEDGYLTFAQNFVEGTKKRMWAHTLMRTCIGGGKKIRTIEKKVDAVASPQKMLGEKYMHASLNDGTTRFFENHRGEGVTNAYDDCYDRLSSEHTDTESVCSSVGSCSPNNSPVRSIDVDTGDVDGGLDDDQTSWSGRESLPVREARGEPGEDIHELELHAYRTTLMALYVSGPISWDQEAMMTNLRCMLHISNDEHLVELKNLASAEKDVSFR